MLQLIDNHFINNSTAGSNKQSEPTGPIHDDVWKGLGFDELLSDKAKALKERFKNMMDDSQIKLMKDYANETMPMHMIPAFQDLKIFGTTKGELPYVERFGIAFEMMKKDASLIQLLSSLGTQAIDQLGNEEQRQRFLPPIQNFEKFSCFALTEPDFGSDASHLRTVAKKVEGGYVITGQKRWISNALISNYIVVCAKNENEKNHVQLFVVENPSKGLELRKIQNKFSLRNANNGDITLKEVFVPDCNRLEYGTDFQNGAVVVLQYTRLSAAWQATAAAIGAYEECVRYCMRRHQFGKPIASFQLVQEKLSRQLGLCEMMLTLCVRLAQRVEKGEASLGQLARCKAICGYHARIVASLARECAGGNSILLETKIMQKQLDIETLYTYEGTYDINSLVSGREITGGIAAFV